LWEMRGAGEDKQNAVRFAAFVRWAGKDRAMSKDREAAGAVLQKILDALAIDDLNINSRGLFEDWIVAHYQPLLEAKDADLRKADIAVKLESAVNNARWEEIVKLKALLEQAREALSRIAESEYDYMTGKHSDEVAKETLAAINAVTGEK